jgi:hypothetical protein
MAEAEASIAFGALPPLLETGTEEGLLVLSESRSPAAAPEPPRECCSFVEAAVSLTAVSLLHGMD